MSKHAHHEPVEESVANKNVLMASRKECRFCNKEILRKVNLLLHEDNCDQNASRWEKPRKHAVLQMGGGNHEGFRLNMSSLQGAAREYRLAFASDQGIEWLVDLHEAITKDANILLTEIKDKEGALFKWYLTLEVTFRQAVNPEIVTDPAVYLHSHPVLLYMGSLLNNLQKAIKTFVYKIDKYEQEGSGWVVDRLITLTVSTMKVENPLLREPIGEDDINDNPKAAIPTQEEGDE